MSRRFEGVINAVVRDRRPRRFRADAEEARLLLTAAALRAGRPDAGGPTTRFIDDLARQLRDADAESDMSPGGRSRRRFLAASGIAAAAAVTGVAGDRLLSGLGRPAAPTESTLVPLDASWQRVAKVTDIPSTGLLRFTASGVTGFVIQSGGTVSAMSAVCTHMGCILHADSGGEIRCPCHNATFSHEGESNPYESTLPRLPRLSARLNAENVEVLLPRSSA